MLSSTEGFSLTLTSLGFFTKVASARSCTLSPALPIQPGHCSCLCNYSRACEKCNKYRTPYRNVDDFRCLGPWHAPGLTQSLSEDYLVSDLSHPPAPVVLFGSPGSWQQNKTRITNQSKATFRKLKLSMGRRRATSAFNTSKKVFIPN